MPRTRRRRLRLLSLALIGAIGLAATTYVVLAPDEPAPREPIFSTGSTFIPPLGPDARRAATAAVRDPKPRPEKQSETVVEPGSPRRLVIPALGVDSAIVPITAPGGTLTPPDDAQQVGWWSAGAEPGAERGSALVTGHTLSRGGAALQDLESLQAGDRIAVRTVEGQIGYRVLDVAILGKGALAEQAGDLFSQSVSGRLVVITCEDFDGSTYLSNVVVTAAPAGRTRDES